MRLESMGGALVLVAGLTVIAACAGGNAANQAEPESTSEATVVKGGDDRAGEYEGVADWWKPAPDHEDPWTWGQVSGVAVDTPDRIIVAIWGDRRRGTSMSRAGTEVG